jgi:hypothetical protein
MSTELWILHLLHISIDALLVVGMWYWVKLGYYASENERLLFVEAESRAPVETRRQPTSFFRRLLHIGS